MKSKRDANYITDSTIVVDGGLTWNYSERFKNAVRSIRGNNAAENAVRVLVIPSTEYRYLTFALNDALNVGSHLMENVRRAAIDHEMLIPRAGGYKGKGLPPEAVLTEEELEAHYEELWKQFLKEDVA